MDIWKTLEIDKTTDKEAIQSAYRKKLVSTNPEDDPQAFMKLRQALEEAIRLADAPQEESREENGIDDNSPTGLWMQKVHQVYDRFSKRIDPQQWEELLKEDVCQQLDTRIKARDALLEYMMEHFFLPQSVIQVLNRHFSLEENMEELRELFPKEFLDVVITESLESQEYPPYDSLKGDDSLPFEDYLKLSADLSGCLGKQDTKQAHEILEQMEATGIESPFCQLDRAKVYCQEERYQDAAALIGTMSLEYSQLEDVHLMKGDVAFLLNDYETARREYEYVLHQDETSSWARLGTGKCLMKDGSYKDAAQVFMDLLQEDPYDAAAEDWLRQCNELHIEELKERCHENQDNLFELAWCYDQNEEYDQVTGLLAGIEPEEEHELEYHSLLGRAWMDGEHGELALEHLKKWAELVESSQTMEESVRQEQMAYILILQSNLYSEKGQHGEALKLVEQALEKGSEESAEILRQKGQILYDMWDFEGAADALSAAIKKDSGSHVTYIMRAKAFYHIEYYGEAFDDCEKALEIYPYELAAYVYKIKILIEVGEFEAAEDTIRYLEEEGVSGSELEFLKGYIQEGRENFGRAEEIYRQIISEYETMKQQGEHIFDTENLAEIYHHLAVMMYDEDAQEFDPVIRMINRGLREDKNYIPLLEMKADISYDCDLYDEALQLYEKILKLAPAKRGIFGMLDNVCRGLDNWDKAMEYAQLQLDQTPTGYAYMRRGQIFTCLDQTKEAWDDFREAVRLSPELPYVYNYMGVLLEAEEREDEALEHYLKAVSVGEEEEDPCIEAYSNASNLYCRQKEFDEALRMLERAYELTDNIQCLYDQVEVLRLGGEFTQAEKVLGIYRKAAGLGRLSFGYNWELGHIYRDCGDLKTAFSIYDADSVAEPAARKEAGKILYYQGKLKKSLKYFKKAILMLDEEHELEEEEFVESDYFLWAGRACLALGDEDGARMFAQDGLSRIPQDFEETLSACLPMVYQMLGGLNTLLGDYEAAEDYLDRAMSIRRCDYCNYSCCIDALDAKAYWYLQQGDREHALAYYKRELEEAPGSMDAAMSVKLLEKGKR